MSLAQSGGALQLPSDKLLRSVALSYLLYHGHKDTARVFAKEIACREAAESVERCPLWQPRDHTSDIDKVMRTPDEADSTLGHGQGTNDLRLDATAISHLNELGVAHTHKSVVPESTLVDVEARRKIRHTILSGRIDQAIELITHHLPTFLPINSPRNGTHGTESETQTGSHDTSVSNQSAPLTSPETPPSRSPTPVSAPSKTVTASEKASQKTDIPTSSTSETDSPKLRDSSEDTPTHTPHNPNSMSLGRSVQPIHILFNLRVQQFVEAVRTIPLLPSVGEQSEASPARGPGAIKSEDSNADIEMHSPSSDQASTDHEHLSKHHVRVVPRLATLSPEARQKRLFELASGLYRNVKTLACASDREIYAKEVEQVCSLMLGQSPEASPAAPYLSMTRREALADQVNSAMLWHIGEPPAPRLQIWAQTTKVVWDQVVAMRPALPRGNEIPADVRTYAKYVARSNDGEEDQAQAQTAVPFDFHALAQA